jgi:hypothetical protein
MAECPLPQALDFNGYFFHLLSAQDQRGANLIKK